MMSPFLFLVLAVLVIFELTESKMIVHHFGPPPDGFTAGQHWVTQVMKQVPKRNRCQSTQQDKWTDCQALLDAGYREDGIYTIYPFQNDEGIKVLCDMTMHTGWIVVQRRYDGSVNFNRSWADYKDGFGSMDGEFWLGNEVLRKLTDTEGNWTIRLDLTNEHNNTGYLIETPFHIGPDNYTLSMEHFSVQPTVGRYCGHALGLEERRIPDGRMTASSQLGSWHQPSNARLNLNRCWNPAEGQYSDSWLQVDMGTEPVQIEGVITQGHPDYDRYVTQYQVQYSIDGNAWLYVNGTSTPQTFDGNTDRNTPVTNIFKQPIQARYIRIRPTAWNRHPALRIELLGCRVDGVCGHSLGVEDGSILDERISTSSTDEAVCSLNPKGRLDVYGGWCPTLSDKDNSWYQVDLQRPALIQGVITKGNNYKGYRVTEFIVSHSGNELDWRYIGGTSKDNAQRFPGNSDDHTRVTNMFNEEIRARYIRIIPTKYQGDRPSMRIELLGCNERWFCLQRLGMGDGSIPHYRVTASSTQRKEDGNCQPSNARLTQSANTNTIGWCPEPNDIKPWLQIDLEIRVTVEGIMMLQGSDQGTSVDKSSEYQLEYSDDQSTWHNMNSTQIIRKNTTSNSEATSLFQPPITARYVRIILNQTDGSLWIRVELLGCKIHWSCRQHHGIQNSSITASNYVGYPAMGIELNECRRGILETANNQAFSINHHTDFNQDKTNCSGLNSAGGWWFNRCSGVPGIDNNLNGEYIQPGGIMGPYKRVIRASKWNGTRIAKTEIKIRRQSPPRG